MASLFVQDNMRVSRRLNLNLGLRWDPWIPFGEDVRPHPLLCARRPFHALSECADRIPADG